MSPRWPTSRVFGRRPALNPLASPEFSIMAQAGLSRTTPIPTDFWTLFLDFLRGLFKPCPRRRRCKLSRVLGLILSNTMRWPLRLPHRTKKRFTSSWPDSANSRAHTLVNTLKLRAIAVGLLRYISDLAELSPGTRPLGRLRRTFRSTDFGLTLRRYLNAPGSLGRSAGGRLLLMRSTLSMTCLWRPPGLMSSLRNMGRIKTLSVHSC